MTIGYLDMKHTTCIRGFRATTGLNRTDRLGEEVKMVHRGAVHTTAPLFLPSTGWVRVARSSPPWGLSTWGGVQPCREANRGAALLRVGATGGRRSQLGLQMRIAEG
jgi:hypothetical protein